MPNKLSINHMLGYARDIHTPQMRWHLLRMHHLTLAPEMTKGQLGELHLLVHAVEAFPDLRDLIGLPNDWYIESVRTKR